MNKSEDKGNKRYKLIFAIILVIFFLHLLFRIFQYKENYFVKFDAKYWEGRYMQSQWVIPNSKNSIGDDGLYTYAGWKYINGTNPILINAEMPPLGKYLIGATILIFKNQNIFGILTALSALLFYYLMNRKLFGNNLNAFLPIFFFSLEPLFWEQMQSTYLDLLQLTFLFAAFYFLLRKNYFTTSLIIGFFAATKFPFLSVIIVITSLIYVMLTDRDNFKKFILSLVMWPVGFIVSYLKFFLLGNNLIDFLKIIKYILNFYSGGAVSHNYLMVYEMILVGKWSTWWGEILNVREWIISWPATLLLSFGVLAGNVKKNPLLLIIIWSILFICFLTFIPVFPRYLLLLIPFLYNISIWVLLQRKSWKFLQPLR